MRIATFLVFFGLLLSNLVSASPEALFFSSYAQSGDVSPADAQRFNELTDIEIKLAMLPWALPAEVYRSVKLASIAWRMNELVAGVGVDVATSAVRNSAVILDLADGVASGVSVAEGVKGAVESTMQLWEGIGLLGDAAALFRSSPGSPVEMMGVDYTAFVGLFEHLELLKAFEKYGVSDPKIIDSIMAKSTLYLIQVSRQLAGLKMITGGELIAYSLEAEIAATLLELSSSRREVLFETWRFAYNKVVDSETFPFTEGRRVLKEEVGIFLEELRLMISDEDLNRGIRTATYTGKAGILLVGLLQTKFGAPDQALRFLEGSREALESWGFKSTTTDYVLAPVEFAAGTIRMGIGKTALWSVGSLAFIEDVSGKGIGQVYEFSNDLISKIGIPDLSLGVLPDFRNLPLPSLPGIGLPAIKLPSVPKLDLYIGRFSGLIPFGVGGGAKKGVSPLCVYFLL